MVLLTTGEGRDGVVGRGRSKGCLILGRKVGVMLRRHWKPGGGGRVAEVAKGRVVEIDVEDLRRCQCIS